MKPDQDINQLVIYTVFLLQHEKSLYTPAVVREAACKIRAYEKHQSHSRILREIELLAVQKRDRIQYMNRICSLHSVRLNAFSFFSFFSAGVEFLSAHCLSTTSAGLSRVVGIRGYTVMLHTI